MRGTRLLLGGVVAYLAYECTCRTRCPSTWNQLSLGRVRVHLHHWILHAIALFALACAPPAPRDDAFLAGLALGGVAHGLTYADWHRVVVSEEA